mmetsp:Transcript_6703/g.11938  ORF Transcript_6703/g.11938 Transcript_6703/m.11938 type:complete len:126 (+) Transcript_6703:59-436(+)
MAFRCLALIVLLVGRPLAIRQENSKGSMAVQDSQVSEDQEVPEFKTKAELDEYYRRRAEMKGVKMPQASAPDKASCLGSRPVHKCSACEFPKCDCYATHLGRLAYYDCKHGGTGQCTGSINSCLR